MSNQPIDYYQSNIVKSNLDLSNVKKKLFFFSMSRLIIFIGVIIGIYFTINIPNIPIVIGFGGIGVFLFMVSKHEDLRSKKRYLSFIVEENSNEVKRLNGNFGDDPLGEEFNDPEHDFSSDIDLFGKGSFFQLINRTGLKEGRLFLSNLLKSNQINEIKEKQSFIKELSKMTDWRQSFKANAGLIKLDVSTISIMSWLSSYKSFLKPLLYRLSQVFPFISVAIISLTVFDFIPQKYIWIWMGIGLVITGRYIKNTNKLAIHTSQLKISFTSYSKLIQLVESCNFESIKGSALKSKITEENHQASDLLNLFAKHLSALDQRNNILFGILGNGFLLWDCNHVYKIEKWIEFNSKKVEEWFEAIEVFDAYNSLAQYAFNYPTYQFPNISSTSEVLIKTEDLGHVLIDAQKRIDNDFIINNEEFKIITGANMAGKSTFLRTVAIAILSANTGLPIATKKMSYRPIKLITSMRNTDSLQDDSSYFFAELSRLKYIVSTIKKEPYFIILDEILKGTNSKDKEEGSIKLMDKLSKSGSSGIIATHDLGLCEISNYLPNVNNTYFDAEIIDDELYFDYKMKEGICQNMNASFLLKKMEII